MVNTDLESGFDSKNGILKVGLRTDDGNNLLNALLIYTIIAFNSKDIAEYCGVRFINPDQDNYIFEDDKGTKIPLSNNTPLLPWRYSIKSKQSFKAKRRNQKRRNQKQRNQKRNKNKLII